MKRDTYLRWAAAMALALVADGPWAGQTPRRIDLTDYFSVVTVLAPVLGDATGDRAVTCDLNGDGYDDLVLSSHRATQPAERGGGASVLLGRSSFPRHGRLGLAELRSVWIYGRGDFLGAGLACGDFNGDGFADLALGAPFADVPGRQDAGEVQLVLGSAQWPAVMDLAARPGVMIARAGEDHLAGSALTAGDINGDGIDDLLVGAPGGEGSGARRSNDVGQVHVLLGRAHWEAALDLVEHSDVVIYGRRGGPYRAGDIVKGDMFGSSIASGDLNLDGIADVAIAAPGALGGGQQIRLSAGEAHVWFGREEWPPVIDMSRPPDLFPASSEQVRQVGDLVFLGAVTYDQLGQGVPGLAIGDLDGDANRELWIGARGGKGEEGGGRLVGELTVYEHGSPGPAPVDLADRNHPTIFGTQDGDVVGERVVVADFDGDGLDDLALSAQLRDGADGSRWRSGVVGIRLGGSELPGRSDFVAENLDVVVYGRAGAEMAVVGAADLNGDGTDELIVAGGLAFRSFVEIVDLNLRRQGTAGED